MRDSAAAEILPIPVKVNGQTFYWTRAEGLDPAAVAQVEGWIQRRADLYLQAAVMRGLDRDDLLQEGRAGALKAAQDYDPAFGASFLSYADHWIRQAMRAALGRSHDLYLTKRARQQAIKDSRLPTVLRLDAHLQDHDMSLGDLLASPAPNPHDQAELSELAAHVWHALDRLEPRHRAVLIHRYGLQGPEESLEAVGRRLGCTREPVRRLQLQAEARLRALLQEKAMSKSPGARPAPPIHPHGTQLTVDDVIRQREREERQRKAEARAQHRDRIEATKGPSLFEEERHD